ncbi:hypothetical protein [Bacillus thuringiensis]|uniref:Uncharacterized protein n=1 Tax=Bacillus thuringiensis TaxID=1428 RepID=A0A9X6ZUY5_BACTU|nr:hypothetical protein [Bacillus thuringiensis]PFJ42725.1 hypothetical protein COJ15_05125 [Bacillus thuringiensis]
MKTQPKKTVHKSRMVPQKSLEDYISHLEVCLHTENRKKFVRDAAQSMLLWHDGKLTNIQSERLRALANITVGFIA